MTIELPSVNASRVSEIARSLTVGPTTSSVWRAPLGAVGHDDLQRAVGALLEPRRERSADRGLRAGRALLAADEERAGGADLPGQVGAHRARVGRAVHPRARRGVGGLGGERERAERQRERVGDAEAAVDRRALGHELGGPQAERPVGERRQHDDGDRAADRERQADPHAGRHVADGERDARQRPHRERQDERREAEAEQDAVAGGGDRQRQDAAPVLGHLAADLRGDARAARLGDRGRRRDDRGDHERDLAAAEQRAQRGERAEGQHAADERAGDERRARRERRGAAARVLAERRDHREPARRPRAGQARDERRDDERRRQHGTFVSKYMTQKTLRPL